MILEQRENVLKEKEGGKLMTKFSELKHQVKSTPYYMFWATASIAVVLGQIYVGTGYRQMSQEIKNLNQTITKNIEELF